MAARENLSEKDDFGALARWGIAALSCCALAVLSANMAALVPETTLSALQETRLAGTSHAQMRSQMQALRTDTLRIASQYATLQTRFDLLSDERRDAGRRLAIVEASLPALAESRQAAGAVDHGLVTASIGRSAGEMHEVEGGSILVRQSPLLGTATGPAAPQPLPPAIAPARPEPDGTSFAVAAGGPVRPAEAMEHYRALLAAAGPLLLGTVPALAEGPDGDGARIVLGPLPDAASAQALCARLARLDVPCLPTAFTGTPLAADGN